MWPGYYVHRCSISMYQTACKANSSWSCLLKVCNWNIYVMQGQFVLANTEICITRQNCIEFCIEPRERFKERVFCLLRYPSFGFCLGRVQRNGLSTSRPFPHILQLQCQIHRRIQGRPACRVNFQFKKPWAVATAGLHCSIWASYCKPKLFPQPSFLFDEDRPRRKKGLRGWWALFLWRNATRRPPLHSRKSDT